MKRLGLAVAAALLLGSLTAASAQNYPDHPIKVIVPFGAGTGIDTLARVVTSELSKDLKQTIIIENKPGALGTVGALYVARAQPDGYTLLFTSNTTHSAAPALVKNIAYDPVKDFTPICKLGTLPSMLLVNPDVPIHSVKEMVAYAKANPGKMTYATGNATGVVTGAALSHDADIKFLSVPYKATTAAIQDTVAGRIMVVNTDFSTGIPQSKAGRLRAIAVTSEHRSYLMPDLPSIAEAGYPGFNVASWQGIFAPPGTPAPIVEKLDRALRKIMLEPANKARFSTLNFEVQYDAHAEFAKFVGTELVKWTGLIKAAGIEAH